MKQKKMHLVLFFNPMGRSPWAWRRQSSGAELLWSLEIPKRAALEVEAAKFDAILLADTTKISDPSMPHILGYEPLTLAGALASCTTRIGLITTVSTTFTAPYNVARAMVTLDHLSGGRAAWNIVTSTEGQEHFGITLPPGEDRYKQAHEHVCAVKALWDSYCDDAVVLDRKNGVWADPDRVRRANFNGAYYKTEGPLTISRSPQGRPVLVQAGQSAAGIEFAATHAELVFTAQTELTRAREFYGKLKEQASIRGRNSAELKILPGIVPIIGRDEEHARAIAAELDGLVDLEKGRHELSIGLQGVDLSDLRLDEPIPLSRLPTPDSVSSTGSVHASRYINLYSLIKTGKITLRGLILERARNLAHGSFTGTAVEFADRMEEWFRNDACDGFIISPPSMPEMLKTICSELVPELQRRRLFRQDYEGTTLRSHLGLSHPTAVANRQM